MKKRILSLLVHNFHSKTVSIMFISLLWPFDCSVHVLIERFEWLTCLAKVIMYFFSTFFYIENFRKIKITSSLIHILTCPHGKEFSKGSLHNMKKLYFIIQNLLIISSVFYCIKLFCINMYTESVHPKLLCCFFCLPRTQFFFIYLQRVTQMSVTALWSVIWSSIYKILVA